MISYGYEAVDQTGKTFKGSIEAESPEKVREELRSRGLTALDISEQSLLNREIKLDIGSKPKSRDLSAFCRQFVSMIRAGVAMLDALRMLAESTENKKLRKAVQEVRASVEKGEVLSAAFAQHPGVFPALMVNLAAAGEASGSMDIAMERMAMQLERNNRTKALVKKTMMYPLMLTGVMLIVVIAMLVKVIPSYAFMFSDLGTQLPGITRAMMNASDFIVSEWPVLLVILILAGVGTASFVRTNAGRHFIGRIVLLLPVTRTIVTKNASAQMARTMSTLLGAGVSLAETTEIAANIMGNIYFKEALQHAREEITIGRALSKTLEESGLFPPMVCHMIRIGEETGNSEEMMDRLADYYEEEIESTMSTLMTVMEPVIIIVMAGVVSVLIAACMAPMLSMYEALDRL